MSCWSEVVLVGVIDGKSKQVAMLFVVVFLCLSCSLAQPASKSITEKSTFVSTKLAGLTTVLNPMLGRGWVVGRGGESELSLFLNRTVSVTHSFYIMVLCKDVFSR